MSYVRVIDIELIDHKLYNDTLELKINRAISEEYPLTVLDVKVIDTEKIPQFNTVRYKVLILFGKENNSSII